jgi:hypothetical protein
LLRHPRIVIPAKAGIQAANLHDLLGFRAPTGEGREDNDIFCAVSSAKNAIAFPPASLRSAALGGEADDELPEVIRQPVF